MSTLVNDYGVNFNKIKFDDRQLFIQNTLFEGESVVYVMSRDQRIQDTYLRVVRRAIGSDSPQGLKQSSKYGTVNLNSISSVFLCLVWLRLLSSAC